MTAAPVVVLGALALLNLLLVLLLARRMREQVARRAVPSQPRWLGPGNKVSAFEATTVGGAKITLNHLLGRPVLAGFFSMTCEPCLEQLPIFAQHAVAVGDREAVLAVIIGPGPAVPEYLTRLDGAAFVVREEHLGPVAAAFSASALPGIYRLDSAGVVVASGPSVAAVTGRSPQAPGRR
ncbi:MAG: TlpA disulfide reductase family protein [Streptosporangiaceae bacterium]